jgi:hypothetical protein
MGEKERDTILARRRRFIIAALSGVTAAAFGCESEVETRGGQGGGGTPQPCLDVANGGSGANVCLGAPLGGMGGGGMGGGGAGGEAGARVCLEAPLGGGGTGG